MKLLNTVLLLIGLVALVMYFKNLFDIREGVLTDSSSTNRRRCPGGYKKNPTYLMTNKKPRSNERKQLIRNMKNHSGRPIRGSAWRRLYKRSNLRVYDYECKPKKYRGVKKPKCDRTKLARAAAGAVGGGATKIDMQMPQNCK